MAISPTTLDELNAASTTRFVEVLGGIFEHAPWVAEGTAARRPFATLVDLHAAMMAVAADAPEAARLALLRAHPELGGKVARAGLMTKDSAAEQGALGLNRLSDAEFERFERLNASYHARFGFPFIICVRRHTRDSILARFERRLTNTTEQEMSRAMEEIGFITRLRLVERVMGPGTPITTGTLTFRLKDAQGRSMQGIRVALHEIGASAVGHIATLRTNAEGGTDAPILSGAPLRIGTYEFRLPDGVADTMARFEIMRAEGSVHVDLLVKNNSIQAFVVANTPLSDYISSPL